ncbi:uncharacterized protein LOC122855035 [Aphidius gifuensis]|uniref:uncharacterized protein LOC122855035 n=1 Tax=Aphidius gifuensis TaxID=684658 RepID=UPI001CDC72A9|nr:uncharacterized protein LOC122855035 [Aphidius gifuensis]
MYNLYRAWFGDKSYPHLEPFSPPDTIIRVGNEGEHHFVAHRVVLATHSGYLKALLSATNTISMAPESYRDGVSSVTSLSVPSVGGETFAPLLNYMYTGRLEVTLDNIYSVLLATHLLHMPGALEKCRAALLRLRGPRVGASIVRPVPNRIIASPLSWPQNDIYSSTFIGFSRLSNLHRFRSHIPVTPSPSQALEFGTSINLYK